MDEAQEYSDDFEQLDPSRIEKILSHAERFVIRLEHYLRQVEAIE
jgi:hypothetical protein